jgi:hypothetical protein
MAGHRGLVSVTAATQEAVAGLRGRVAPSVMEALAGLAAHGAHVATETGWHGGDSERWLAEFQTRYEFLRRRLQGDLDELCGFAEASFRQIASAGGGLA